MLSTVAHLGWQEHSICAMGPGNQRPALKISSYWEPSAWRRVTKLIQGQEHLSCGDGLGAGAAQAGGETSEPLPGHKRAGEALWTRTCRDRAKGNGLQLKESRFRLKVRNSPLLGW